MLLWIGLSLLLPGHYTVEGNEAQANTDAPRDAVSVPMEVYGNRVFIPAKVNGKTVKRCLIDTGSEVTLINQAHVRLERYQRVGGDRLQGSFVGGINAKRILVPSFEMGSQVFNRFRASLIDHRRGQPLHLIQMLLGMDFLGRRRFSLDFEKKRFLLWHSGTELPPPRDGSERIRLPVHRALVDGTRRPWIWGALKGSRRVCFLLDTGADSPIFPIFKDPKHYGVVLEKTSKRRSVGRGRSVQQYEASAKRLTFGEIAFLNVPVRVIDASTVRHPVTRRTLSDSFTILGATFLKRLRVVHVDMPAGQVCFDVEPPPDKKK